jgi:very-short-patch-repair endonuclease
LRPTSFAGRSRSAVTSSTCCARLIVELDGSQHAENAYDAGRDAWLAAQGFRVLRVWNGDLLSHPDGIVELIWSNLQEGKS